MNKTKEKMRKNSIIYKLVEFFYSAVIMLLSPILNIKVAAALKFWNKKSSNYVGYALKRLQAVRTLSLIVTLLIISAGVFAIPQTFNAHGKLTDSSGSALSGTYNMTFRIYDSYTGGTLLWNKTNRTVTTDSNGVYSVILKDIDLNFSQQFFLGVEVQSDGEMTPRINLTSTPYAFRAQNITVAGVEFSSNVDIGAHNFTVDSGTLFVDSTGNNVGIGTTSPWDKLHINGFIRTENVSWTLNNDFGTDYGSIETLAVYNGKLYIGLSNTIIGSAVYVYDGSTWSLSNNFGEAFTTVESLAVYNGKLYAGLGEGAGDADVYVYNGSNWSSSNDFGTDYDRVQRLTVYNGKLYAGLGDGAGDADVYVFDGSSWTLSNDFGAGYNRVHGLTVYNGKLYAGLGTGTDDADVYVYDGSSWTLNYDFGSDYGTIRSLIIYNGKLYAGLGTGTDDADVYVYDGSSWTLNYDFGAVYNRVESLVSYNGKLYAGLRTVADNSADIYVYDGSSWSLNKEFAGYTQVEYLAEYNGKLYAGLGRNAGNADVYVYSERLESQLVKDFNPIITPFNEQYQHFTKNVTVLGNVGIGTTSPSTKLHVVGTTGSAVLNVSNGTTGMYMDKSGNVGIGTTTPAHKLEVAGSMNISGDLNVSGRATIGSLNVTGASYLGSATIQSDNITTNNIKSKDGNISFFNNSNNEVMRIVGSSGSVGIGTASPLTTLYVVESDWIASMRGIQSVLFGEHAHSAHITGRRARGTPDSPAALQVNDYLAGFTAEGYNGSQWLRAGHLAWTATNVTSGAITTLARLAVHDTAGTARDQFITYGNTGTTAIGRLGAETYSDFGTTVYSVGSIAGNLNINGSSNRAITTYVKGTYSGGSPIRVFRGYGQISASNSNPISSVNGMTFFIEHLGSGNLTDVVLYGGSFTLNKAASTVSNLYGIQLFDSTVTAGTLTSATGVAIRKFTAATSNTQLLSGTTTIPSGNFGIYEASNYNNYFSGNVGIGTTSPSKKLVVNGTTEGITFEPNVASPVINTTTSASNSNITITSSGGSVIIRLG